MPLFPCLFQSTSTSYIQSHDEVHHAGASIQCSKKFQHLHLKCERDDGRGGRLNKYMQATSGKKKHTVFYSPGWVKLSEFEWVQLIQGDTFFATYFLCLAKISVKYEGKITMKIHTRKKSIKVSYQTFGRVSLFFTNPRWQPYTAGSQLLARGQFLLATKNKDCIFVSSLGCHILKTLTTLHKLLNQVTVIYIVFSLIQSCAPSSKANLASQSAIQGAYVVMLSEIKATLGVQSLTSHCRITIILKLFLQNAAFL